MSSLEPLDGPVWLFFVAAFGAAWGSFANVVICRWPRGLSVVRPGSHCFSCGTQIAWYDNVPIVSYVLLRGRCRTCGATISARYAAVELSLALLAVASYRQTIAEQGALELVPALEFLVSYLFCWTLVVVAFIDLASQLVPSLLTGAVTVVALAAHLALPGGDPAGAAIGVVVGAGLIVLLGQGYRLFRGELGMGAGDAHLMAMVGGALGWKGALFTLVAGSVQGALVHVVLWLADRKWREGPVSAWRRPVPFGPFLAAGALEFYVLRDIVDIVPGLPF